MTINFHILDGIKIGGIENLAFTLSSEKMSLEQNYLINLNKNLISLIVVMKIFQDSRVSS